MKRLSCRAKLAVAWTFVVAFAALSASRSDAATFNIQPLDPSGNSTSTATISGSLAAPTTLDFVLTLGNIPSQGVNGNATLSVFNQNNDQTSFFAFGLTLSGDPDSTLTGAPFGTPGVTLGSLSNVTHFVVDFANGDLPLLVQLFLALSDPISGLPFAGSLDFAVDLPRGLVGANAVATPLPGALVLFASGLGMFSLARARRRRAIAVPMSATAIIN